ncbi:MAG TPA: flagellar export protein FliJ [Tepidisphaeraceae bacterium]|jgi:flagellar FliJ protein|nr:flagellar export protein FliJ [Tepidisphaeraceae bacterium]
MPQFHFPLAGVLRHREHLEQECQRNVAGIQQRMREAQDALRELDQSMQRNIAEVRENRLVGRLDMGFLAAHRRYIASVQRKGTMMAQKMALMQRELDTARAALSEAAKQRKIIEKLREKQMHRWQQERDRKESAELDEMSMRLFASQSGERIVYEDGMAGEL